MGDDLVDKIRYKAFIAFHIGYIHMLGQLLPLEGNVTNQALKTRSQPFVAKPVKGEAEIDPGGFFLHRRQLAETGGQDIGYPNVHFIFA
jgi:hypothetical protein